MRRVVMGLVGVMIGCTGDALMGPRRPLAPDTPSAKVYPPWAYSVSSLFPGQQSVATAVNDLNQVAGHVGGSAFLRESNGTVYLLPLNGAAWATATDITTHGVVSGAVLRNGVSYPAVWTTPTAPASELPRPGGVHAINDRLEAVGRYDRKGFPRPMYWDVRNGTAVFLPVPPGTTQGFANDINNDRIIVGEVDGRGATWRWNGTTWVFASLNGIRAWGVDAGYGTVGITPSGQAAFGSPDLTGLFPTVGLSTAWDTNGRGVATGEDWNLTTNRMDAWVGDRNGNFSILPFPSGSTAFQASGRAVNTCGLVVGFIAWGATQEAVMWDPGC
ncbi:MAG: hypothetical protein IPK85_08370 [Gemmatimonadetes bacterium]|nr:hypothetical protein [Gemmatimonadota bacterium]